MSGKEPEVLPPVETDATDGPQPAEPEKSGELVSNFLADGSQVFEKESAPVPVPLDTIHPDDDSASLPSAPGQVSRLSYYMA